MISLPFEVLISSIRRLERIADLFFDFFQFVFHLNDVLLHRRIVTFRTYSIDFPTNLLSDKAQFFPGIFLLHSFAEVFNVIRKTHFLFVDI